MVWEADNVCVVAEPQAKRTTAIHGQEFMQQVATDPHSDQAACAGTQQAAEAPTPT